MADEVNEAPRQKTQRDGSSLPRVRAISRAVAVLRAFTASEPRLGLGEIATRAGLDAGTTRRILVTLRDARLVSQDQASGQYFLTLEMMRLAAAVPEQRDLREAAADLLEDLSARLGGTVFLAVVHNDEALCISRHMGRARVQVRWWAVGGTMPLHLGAAPRLLLATMPEAARERVLSGSASPMAGGSAVDVAALRAELVRIRARGWSYARDDVAPGLSALAVPVRDTAGRVRAAISVGGLTPMLGEPAEGAPPEGILAELLGTAEQIGNELSDNFII